MSVGPQIVSAARDWLGTPYRHQASLRGVGSDCLGLVRGVWRDCYGTEPQPLPAYSARWAETGRSETLLHAAHRHFQPVGAELMQPGDLLIFRMTERALAKHCGIFSRRHPTPLFIHAYEGNAVVEAPLIDFWRRRVAGVFRFPPLQEST